MEYSTARFDFISYSKYTILILLLQIASFSLMIGGIVFACMRSNYWALWFIFGVAIFVITYLFIILFAVMMVINFKKDVIEHDKILKFHYFWSFIPFCQQALWKSCFEVIRSDDTKDIKVI
jgi:hypothetical protein